MWMRRERERRRRSPPDGNTQTRMPFKGGPVYRRLGIPQVTQSRFQHTWTCNPRRSLSSSSPTPSSPLVPRPPSPLLITPRWGSLCQSVTPRGMPARQNWWRKIRSVTLTYRNGPARNGGTPRTSKRGPHELGDQCPQSERRPLPPILACTIIRRQGEAKVSPLKRGSLRSVSR